MEEARSTCTWCDQEMELRHLPESKVREPQVQKRIVLAHLVNGMYRRAMREPGYGQCWTTHGYEFVPLENILTLQDKKLCSSRYRSDFRYLEKEEQRKYFGVLHRTETRGLASDEIAPEWVVAIRGTIPTRLQDLKEDVKIILELLNTSSTIKLLKLVVSRLLKVVKGDGSKVAITGHSLGASMGMLVARGMALQDHHTDSHFFNPPFATLTSLAGKLISRFLDSVLDSVVSDKIKNKMRALKCTVTKIYNRAVDGCARLQKEEKEHMELRKWAPHLYLNVNDVICNKYIYYFTRRWRRSDLLASYHSFGSSFLRGISQSFHFLPRAICFISAAKPAHSLQPWINCDLPVEVQNCETTMQDQDHSALGKENFIGLLRCSPEGDTVSGYGSYSEDEEDSCDSESSESEADDSSDEDEEVDSFSEGVEVDSKFKVDGSIASGEELSPATLHWQTLQLLKMLSLESVSEGVEFNSEFKIAHSGGTEDSAATLWTQQLLEICPKPKCPV